MKAGAGIAIGLSVALAAGGGYWLGQRPAAGPDASVVAATEGGKKERKLLYYRNPMGLPDTSPTPKKDPMGMDYVAVYAGEQDDEPSAPNQIKISTEKVQKLGVRVETAQLRALDRNVRAAGRIEPDERRVFSISPKFEGYVERLHVNVTGQPVSKGQALFEVYSPELVSAQREYAIAVQGMDSLKGADSTVGTKIDDATEGFVKILYEPKFKELLGVHIVGAKATELIAEFALAKVLESTVDEIGHTIHPHPTISETIMEAAHTVMGGAIHM